MIFVAMFFMLLAGWFFFWFMLNWARFDNPKISGFTLLRDFGLAIFCFWAAVQAASRL